MAGRFDLGPHQPDEEDFFFSWDDHISVLPPGALLDLGLSLCIISHGRDYIELASILGFSVHDVKLIETECPYTQQNGGPGLALLEKWRDKPHSRLRVLRNAFRKMSLNLLSKLNDLMANPHYITVVLYEELANGTRYSFRDLELLVRGHVTLAHLLVAPIQSMGLELCLFHLDPPMQNWTSICAHQFRGQQVNVVRRDSTSRDTPSPIQVVDASISEEEQPAIMRSVKGRSGHNSQDGPHTSTAVSSVATSGVYSACSLLSVASYGVYERAALLSLISVMDDGASRDHIQEVTAGMGSLSLAIDDHLLPTLPRNHNKVLGWMDGFLERDGSYILWQLSSDHLNMLLLSVVYQKSTIHFPVASEKISDQVYFCLAQDTYRATSLSDLISHYHDQPLPHRRIDPTLVLTQLIQESSC